MLILAADIGTGTQDILLFNSEKKWKIACLWSCLLLPR